MEKIEILVIQRVTELNKRKLDPDNKVKDYEEKQRTLYKSEKR
jgi:hypothetical protein